MVDPTHKIKQTQKHTKRFQLKMPKTTTPQNNNKQPMNELI